MQLLLAAVVGAGSLAWLWGALSGRLASMAAGLIQPSWLVPTGAGANPAASASSAVNPITVPPPGSPGGTPVRDYPNPPAEYVLPGGGVVIPPGSTGPPLA